MLPSILSEQIQRGTEDFLRTTFPPSNPFFHGILDRFLEEPGGMFKGPYVSMKLPFRPGRLDEDFFPGFSMGYRPYAHQENAFQRLTGDPASTLISTGTGSGKTECFLYPVLEHCYCHRGEAGIKAILIYPMNALATDQAGRIAEEIHKAPRLRGTVRAGLFVGGEAGEASAVMTKDGVITGKDALRKHPPDILLTNYKMLDYLLIRPQDFPLWRDNGPETLKFLVVDELHTFDGAQGTDLACLVRRVKERLHTPEGHLCCVGTSATLGGDDDVPGLRAFAEELFGEPFDERSVITEDVLSPSEFFGETYIRRSSLPMGEQLEELDPERFADERAYLRAQVKVWFRREPEDPEAEAFRLELASLLMEHMLFRNLVLVLKNDILSVQDLLSRLVEIQAELEDVSPVQRHWVLMSLLSLVSLARVGEPGSTRPFLHVRIQLWIRELRRMLGSVEKTPRLRFADDLPVETTPAHLPLVHCRECGAMGWTAMKRPNDSRLSCELSSFYRAFFEERSPNVHFVFPSGVGIGSRQIGLPTHVCGHCLEVGHGPTPECCGHCGAEGTCLSVDLFNPLRTSKNNNRHTLKHDCPFCQAHESLTLLGSRAASLLAVGIGQLYATPFYLEKPKKLLAFSNSVQDASHRAGFFEARTYGFNFRSALQKVIADASDTLPLEQLPGAFYRYWNERMSGEEFQATFLAPNLAWREEAEIFLTGKGPASKELKSLIERRIDWEIWSELTFRARIGRTLEKSGVAAIALDPQRLEKAEGLLAERLSNELGMFKALRAEQLRGFVIGFLHQMRVRGGVYREDLRGYVQDWGNTWLLNRVDYLPSFSPHGRAPAFPTTKMKMDRFDALTAKGSSGTWAESWLQRTLGGSFGGVDSFAVEIFRLLMQALVETGLLREWMDQEPQVWALSPEALRVEAVSVQLSCDHCGQSVSAAVSEQAWWEGSPCRRFGCVGHLSVGRSAPDYYGRLYRDGIVDRIYTAEHTGLLERSVREQVEKDFAGQNLPSSPNLLSCTPTLEMGINIGDLSSLLLCGIPPTQSSYLQRVGRSGRRDGNAFNLTLAEGKPHDLYFYHEPLDMVAGAVDPPGVFLNAPMVLERQFMGFCFDRWIETGVTQETFPRKMSLVLRNMKTPQDASKFPFNLLAFIETERTPLLQRFLEVFDAYLSEDARDHLRRFVEGDVGEDTGSLNFKILDRLHYLNREVESFRKRVKSVQKAIRDRETTKAKDQNTEREIEDLQREKQALNRMIRALRDKETFNFFTDEGLLPNYAFPEAGVTLRSVIWRKRSRQDGDKGKYETRVYEYVRPAALALRELAPSNTFFAESRKVTVDRVSLDLAEVETWRFCSECSHAELMTGQEVREACPKCGDPLWVDAGQVRTMVRIRQVEARTSERDSRVDDSSEIREPLYYNQQMQVEVSPQHIETAYGLEDADTPFGYEFVRRAEFRDINFGLGGDQQTSMKVAGREVPVQGFEVCKGCGKVRSGPNKPIEHAITCRYYGSEEEAPCVNSLYLYRQFRSEAVRILLPVTSEGVDVKLHSFVASVYLGLKKRFRGSIDHLQTAIMDEPVPESAARKRYLVLYDSVPGGTGYLKELTKTPDTMMEVLETALAVLRECECGSDEEKDGCYHCLYAFRLSRDMANISRREAMDLLSGILSRKDQLRERASVADLSINGLLESELEARFIESLRRMRHGGDPLLLVKDVVKGKPGWQMKVGPRTWQIEPQPQLGPSDGVSVPCKPDFLFWPLRQAGVRPVAVFTDGCQYHADEESGHVIVDEDMEKRMAILRSGTYRVWSFSWEDVARALANEEPDHLHRWMQKGQTRGMALFDRFEQQLSGIKALAGLPHAGPLRGLVAYLGSDTEDLWCAQAFFHAISFADSDFGMVEPNAAVELEQALRSGMPWQQLQVKPEWGDPSGGCFMGVECIQDDLKRPFLARWTSVERDKIKLEHVEDLKVLVRLFDDVDLAVTKAFRRSWNTMLQMMNLLQFLPGCRFVTSRGLAADRDDRTVVEGQSEATTGTVETSLEWEEEGKYLAGGIRPLWKALHAAGFPLPVVGYELAGTSGEVLGMAEIAWPERKQAVLLPEDAQALDLFKARGWSVDLWSAGSGADPAVVEAFVCKLKEEESP